MGTYSFHLTLDKGCVWKDPAYNGDYYVYITKAVVEVKDENGDIIAYVYGTEGIDADCKITVKGTRDTSEIVKGYDISGNPVCAYSVTFTKNGKEVISDGDITLLLAIPDGVNTKNMKVYQLNGTDAVQVPYSISGGSYIKVGTDSPYAYVFSEPEQTAFTETFWFWVIIGIFILADIALLAYLIKRRTGYRIWF